jgi:transcriptional regulator with XRE-family HTH domain
VSQAPEGSPADGTLAQRIEWLIANRWPPDAPPPTSNTAAAGAISAATGEELSHTALWKLRTGRSANPTLKTITALAAFFGVPPAYLTAGPEADDIAGQLALLIQLRDLGITGAALQALADMPEESRRAVLEIIAAQDSPGGRGKDDSRGQ